jgi:hypothetical protein
MRRAHAAPLAAPLALLFAACPAAEPPARGDAGPRSDPPLAFEDVTAAAGVDFVHDAGRTAEKHLPEAMGAGAALFDADEDGDLDLYLVQGGPLPAGGGGPDRFAYGALESRPTNRLFLNDGRARFADATAKSGDAQGRRYGMGVAVGDANGDGHEDLYLTNLGPDALLSGDGHASFQDVTRASGIEEARWTTGAAFFDADDDGDLDLFVASYVEVDLADAPWCGERRDGWRSVCHPDRFRGTEDRFWKNRGDGTFEDATAAAGFSDPNGKGLCVLASDLDGDGRTDLFVANDSTENRFYRNLGGGRFEDATLLSGLGVDRYGRTEASMGVASGDVDLDGDLDVFVTGFDDESDTLYVNQGGGLFDDRTVQASLEHVTRLPVGFGCVLADFDLDGALDLAIANGHIVDNIELYHDGKSWRQRALALRGDGAGRFTDASGAAAALCGEPRVGRALVAGDLDGDLALDLVVTECGGPARVLLGRGPSGPAAGGSVQVAGLPFGARVELRGARGELLGVREAIPQPSYLGQSAREPHFGLAHGQAAHALRVRVGAGAWQELALDPPLARGRIALRRGADGALTPAR